MNRLITSKIMNINLTIPLITKGTGQKRVSTYLILHYLCFEVVLIDLIYRVDILDLKFGSQTFMILLEALVLGLGQSCWVGLESWALTRE